MERIKSLEHRVFADLPKNVRIPFARALEAISVRATNELEAWLGLGTMRAAGFAQHYGLPTEFLDVTASLAVATAFAIGDPERWTSPKRVHFAVLDMRQAIDRCVIADLGAMVQIARRPRVQSAYGFFHRSHRDLKDLLCIADVGLRWHEILVHPQEALSHAAMPNLLDGHRDQVAGALQLILDELAKNDGNGRTPSRCSLVRRLRRPRSLPVQPDGGASGRRSWNSSVRRMPAMLSARRRSETTAGGFGPARIQDLRAEGDSSEGPTSAFRCLTPVTSQAASGP